MNSRVILTLLCCGALAFACAPRTRSESSSPKKPSVRQKRAPESAPLVSRVDVSVDDEVRFALFVTNASAKGVELEFPDARTHDFAVVDSVGREVWRWSRNRLFTSALQTRTLGRDDSKEFAESWDPAGAHGRFTVVATLASTNFPLEQRAEFRLP